MKQTKTEKKRDKHENCNYDQIHDAQKNYSSTLNQNLNTKQATKKHPEHLEKKVIEKKPDIKKRPDSAKQTNHGNTANTQAYPLY